MTRRACVAAHSRSLLRRLVTLAAEASTHSGRYTVALLDRLTWEAQIEPLNEPRDALGVHLKPVASAEVSQDVWLGLGDAPEVNELAEEPLEACRGDDLQDPGGCAAGVPECVPLVVWREHQMTRTGVQYLVAKGRTHTSLQDVAVLVLVRVSMQRCSQRARGHRVLDHGEGAVRVLAVNHEPDADAPQEPSLAVARPNDPCYRRRHRLLIGRFSHRNSMTSHPGHRVRCSDLLHERIGLRFSRIPVLRTRRIQRTRAFRRAFP